MDISKCPMHPSTSGESQYGGYYCWGNVDGEKCKFAVKEFVNDTPEGGVEKVTKYHLPQPGKWLTKEDYIGAAAETPAARETAADDPFPPDDNPPEDGNFGPHLADAPDVTSDTPEATGQTLWAKDRLRARTDCIACATGIYKSCLEAGIYKEFPSAETVVKYAATLELWAKE